MCAQYHTRNRASKRNISYVEVSDSDEHSERRRGRAATRVHVQKEESSSSECYEDGGDDEFDAGIIPKLGKGDPKKPCVICGKPSSRKKYTTRLYINAYKACFPEYDGTIGLVCSTCYNKCYSLRRSRLSTNVRSPKFSKQILKPNRKYKRRSVLENKNCTCCDSQLSRRAYFYKAFKDEFAELFPNSVINGKDPDARVCYTCYMKGEHLRSMKSYPNDTISNALSHNASDTPVVAFLEFRFLQESSKNQRFPTVVRVELPPRILVSDLKTFISTVASRVFSKANYHVEYIRRVCRDYHGFQVLQNLWLDELLRTYPLHPMERFLVFLSNRL
jgi:hypothetical protein